MQTIFHIRRKLKPARGNQFYKEFDPSRRYNGTYCGDDPTSFDIGWKDSHKSWNNGDNVYVACAKCVTQKAIENK